MDKLEQRLVDGVELGVRTDGGEGLAAGLAEGLAEGLSEGLADRPVERRQAY